VSYDSFFVVNHQGIEGIDRSRHLFRLSNCWLNEHLLLLARVKTMTLSWVFPLPLSDIHQW